MALFLTDATLNSLGNDLAAKMTHASLHSGAPGSTGANETSAGRVALTWTVDADGDLTDTGLAFTGGAASGAVGYIGFWTAASGGTFRGHLPLTGDATFNASGEYTVTTVTVPVATS